jgi:hypothetical protein
MGGEFCGTAEVVPSRRASDPHLQSQRRRTRVSDPHGQTRRTARLRRAQLILRLTFADVTSVTEIAGEFPENSQSL